MADQNYPPSITTQHGGHTPEGTALTGPGTDVPMWAGLGGVLILAAVASLVASKIRQRRAQAQ